MLRTCKPLESNSFCAISQNRERPRRSGSTDGSHVSLEKIRKPISVGWEERSETHRFLSQRCMMGFAALFPSYELTLRGLLDHLVGAGGTPCPLRDSLGSCPPTVGGSGSFGATQMSEREGRKFFFLLQAILAVLFLIVGVALAIEAASGGYGIGLVIVAVMANGPGLVFFILAALSAATAMHLRP